MTECNAVLTRVLSVLMLVAAVCVAQPADSASLEAGLRAYDRQDYRAAHSLLEPYAQAGESEAQLTLGRLFAKGDGVLQDYVQAHRWFNLAASGGLRRARIERDAIAEKMTPRQIARAQTLARNFQPNPEHGQSSGSPPLDRQKEALPPLDLTEQVQRMLTELGYDPGPSDGVAGAKTRSAIRTYQSHSGLTQDGQVSVTLYNTLAADLGRPPIAEDSTDTGSTRSPDSSNPSENPPAEYPRSRTLSAALGAALGAISELADEAERERSADRNIIRAMRGIVSRYQSAQLTPPPRASSPARPERVLLDTFSDGDYERQPSWRVRSGGFWVDQRKQLRSDVQRGEETKELSKDEIPLAILGALLGQPAGVHPKGKAVIEVASQIPEAHEVRTGFSVGSGPSELQLSLLNERSQRSARTLRIVFAANRATLSLHDGHSGTIDQVTLATTEQSRRIGELAWRTDASGRTQVTVDGQTVLNPWSTLRRSTFSTLRITNTQGQLAVDFVEVKRLRD